MAAYSALAANQSNEEFNNEVKSKLDDGFAMTGSTSLKQAFGFQAKYKDLQVRMFGRFYEEGESGFNDELVKELEKRLDECFTKIGELTELQWNMQPLPLQSTYGIFINLFTARGNWLSTYYPSVLGGLFVTVFIQALLINIVQTHMTKDASEEDEKLDWKISAPCIWLFILALAGAAKNGWFVSFCAAFSGQAIGGLAGDGKIHTYQPRVNAKWPFFVAGLAEAGVWLYMSVVGVGFLLGATSAEEILMNSLALTFIFDIDETLYEITCPQILKMRHDQDLYDCYWDIDEKTRRYKESLAIGEISRNENILVEPRSRLEGKIIIAIFKSFVDTWLLLPGTLAISLALAR